MKALVDVDINEGYHHVNAGSETLPTQFYQALENSPPSHKKE